MYAKIMPQPGNIMPARTAPMLPTPNKCKSSFANNRALEATLFSFSVLTFSSSSTVDKSLPLLVFVMDDFSDDLSLLT